jgi:Zn-dependent membrane protease YugP
MIWIIIIGFAILGFIVQRKLKSKFAKYSRIPIAGGMSGAEAAAMMLRDNNLTDVQITAVPGKLTDHYHPGQRTVNLSEEVYHGRNAAAVAVAAHECGHAIQHATAYTALKMRSAMVPVQIASAKLLNILFMVSMFGVFMFNFVSYDIILLGIIGCYAVITAFSVLTLPVEMDASKRALAWLDQRGVVQGQEYDMAADALKWAGRTYIVAALSSLTMLAYFVMSYMGRD